MSCINGRAGEVYRGRLQDNDREDSAISMAIDHIYCCSRHTDFVYADTFEAVENCVP